MKYYVPITALILFFMFAIVGCTENEMAKNFGGTMYVDLDCGQKLFDITWKNDSFWYATRPMRDEEFAETYTFQEDSAYGIYEGKVIVRECVK